MPDSPWRDWMPTGLGPGPAGWRVRWCFFRGLRPTDPFLYQTVSQALTDPARRLFQRQTPIGFLAELAARHPGITPRGFIFHLSRCGSTLVAQMLAAVPRHLVLSEAPAIDEALQLALSGPPVSREAGRAVLRGLVSAMGQARSGETALFIKFDSWHVRELAEIRATFPGVPWVFLYRDPVEILVSQRRVVGTQMVPGLLDPGRLGIDPASVDPAATVEYAARVLAQFCQTAIEQAALGGGLLVNYADLPGAARGPIARHFGLELAPADLARMTAAARFDAKAPRNVFAPDGAAKQAEAGDELRRIAGRWLAALYARLEEIRLAQG